MEELWNKERVDYGSVMETIAAMTQRHILQRPPPKQRQFLAKELSCPDVLFIGRQLIQSKFFLIGGPIGWFINLLIFIFFTVTFHRSLFYFDSVR